MAAKVFARLTAGTARNRGLLLVLGAASAGFIVIHVALGAMAMLGVGATVTVWESGWWRIDRERSVSEVYETALLLGAGFAFSVLWRQTSLAIFGLLAGVSAFLALDNMAAIHEKFGRLMAPFNALGEVLFFGVVGIVVAVFWVRFVTGISVRARVHALVCSGPLVVAAIFGVGVDAVHSVVGAKLADTGFSGSAIGQSLGILEDGGELIAVTLFAGLALLSAGGGRDVGALRSQPRASVNARP